MTGEQELFVDYLDDREFVVAGFSYGAIEAFEYCLSATTRINKLQLLSPAFFQNTTKSFKKKELQYFSKNPKAYMKQFYENITDQNIDKYKTIGTKEQLNKLLNYQWNINQLDVLTDKGTNIEIFLGLDDTISPNDDVITFFKNFATIYQYKNKGHML